MSKREGETLVFEYTFENENENVTDMSLYKTKDENGTRCVIVRAKGPHSETDHMYTYNEAKVLAMGLNICFGNE